MAKSPADQRGTGLALFGGGCGIQPQPQDRCTMLKEVAGDILLSKAQAIAHGVAPGDHFANGLALSLRERWPSMVKDFRHYSKVSNPKPGTVWTWAGTDGQRIVSLLTQEAAPDHNGVPGPAHLEYVHRALKDLRRFVETENIRSLAIPKLATTAGRLEWKDVYPLIQQSLGDLKIPVYVYTTYHKGVAASEA